MQKLRRLLRMIFTEVGLAKAKEYRGKKLTAKVGKKHQVVLGVEVDNFSINDGVEEYKLNKNILYLMYVGTLDALKLIPPQSDVNICRCVQVGNDIDEDTIKGILSETPMWVTPCIELPEDFKNIKFVCEMCKKYETLRFVGGKLFQFPEVNFGYFTEKMLENKGFSLKEVPMFLDNKLAVIDFVDESQLDIEVKEAKKSARKASSNSAGKRSQTKKEKRAVRFSSLLNSNQVEL